jgi:exodeoxyribonuclease-3
MKVASWNVNGIRAIERRGDFKWLEQYNAEVFFLQETKAAPEQLDERFAISGYEAFFATSTIRKGYSGVATYSRIPFTETIVGLGVDKFDEQGRVLTHITGDIALVNAYMPNGGGSIAPLSFKLEFYDTFLAHLENLRSQGLRVIAGGDFNVAHEEIDLARPAANRTNIGFLPEERAWIDELIRSGYVDIWRTRNPRTVAYTYWDNKSRSRERNVGWRIDYFFISTDLVSRIKEATSLPNVFGSDHCPIVIDFDA